MNLIGLEKADLGPVLDASKAALAREIAMDIQELNTILAAHGITPEEFERLKQDPSFARYLQSAVTEWNSAGSTQERIRVKAAAMVEEALPSLHTSTLDEKIPLTQRVEALKFTAKLAALVDEKGGAAGSIAPGSGFSVTINIGGDSVKITQQAPEVIEADDV